MILKEKVNTKKRYTQKGPLGKVTTNQSTPFSVPSRIHIYAATGPRSSSECYLPWMPYTPDVLVCTRMTYVDNANKRRGQRLHMDVPKEQGGPGGWEDALDRMDGWGETATSLYNKQRQKKLQPGIQSPKNIAWRMARTNACYKAL